ncbi:MAG: hypothetical protein PHI97_24970 [Desulfobulbus sp.]|nr:hypothetical protein [Desulfobulbus sp.]
MKKTLKELQVEVAANAKEYKAGNLSWDDFILNFGDIEVEDPLIDELVDMIEHEPKRGGFMGASETEWKQYEERINNLIEELLR